MFGASVDNLPATSSIRGYARTSLRDSTEEKAKTKAPLCNGRCKKMANVSMKPRKKPAVKRNTAEKVGLRGRGPHYSYERWSRRRQLPPATGPRCAQNACDRSRADVDGYRVALILSGHSRPKSRQCIGIGSFAPPAKPGAPRFRLWSSSPLLASNVTATGVCPPCPPPSQFPLLSAD